ncbi:HAD-IC family P-type ATPase [Azospirillum sp.]|uniref:HAD-IC family P-type ATPase n=1 Tax=Azospirillum sp. TaxID=34012 RepID=UPI002D700B06|nr:HAD-IC family P-type ATPase [Azospirillum sp.]HYD69195.1 HAD-IC family P-type ATPase [Azospirillum sp.]
MSIERHSRSAEHDPATLLPVPWHTLAAEAVRRNLLTAPGGLDEAEAHQRLSLYGPNRLALPRRRGPLLRLLMQFHNVLLYVMLGAAAITAGLGHWVDTGVLLAAVLINAVIGFLQEGKAETALDAIRGMLSPHATVVRNGNRREINAADLVPGDLVLLSSGDRVPADLRLIAAKELRVEEAALTGESLPVEKSTAAVSPEAPWATAMAWPIRAPWSCMARARASPLPPAAPPNWAGSTACWPASAA